MAKSKVLSVVLAGAMVAAMGAVSVSAANADTDSFGICGEYNGWGASADAEMTKEGTVFTGSFVVESVSDAGTTQFKVRTNNSWDDSWGALDENDMTYNSQTNCEATANVGDTIVVKIDTAGDEAAWPVTFEVVAAGQDDPQEEESKEEESKQDTPTTGDSTSAFALVGVVVAALGVAVVMTKKASVK